MVGTSLLNSGGINDYEAIQDLSPARRADDNSVLRRDGDRGGVVLAIGGPMASQCRRARARASGARLRARGRPPPTAGTGGDGDQGRLLSARLRRRWRRQG